MSRKTLAVSFDADGCMFGPESLRNFSGSGEELYRCLISSHPVLLERICEVISKERYELVLIMLGSARQNLALDWVNAREGSTPSAAFLASIIQVYLQRQFPDITIQIDPVLLGDVFDPEGMPGGQQELMRQSQPYTEKRPPKAQYYPFDEHKFMTLYLQLHRAKLMAGSGELHYILVDDRADILAHLRSFCLTFRYALPQAGVTFFHYEGYKCNGVKEFATCKTTGEVDQYYRQTILTMAAFFLGKIGEQPRDAWIRMTLLLQENPKCLLGEELLVAVKPDTFLQLRQLLGVTPRADFCGIISTWPAPCGAAPYPLTGDASAPCMDLVEPLMSKTRRALMGYRESLKADLLSGAERLDAVVDQIWSILLTMRVLVRKASDSHVISVLVETFKGLSRVLDQLIDWSVYADGLRVLDQLTSWSVDADRGLFSCAVTTRVLSETECDKAKATLLLRSSVSAAAFLLTAAYRLEEPADEEIKLSFILWALDMLDEVLRQEGFHVFVSKNKPDRQATDPYQQAADLCREAERDFYGDYSTWSESDDKNREALDLLLLWGREFAWFEFDSLLEEVSDNAVKSLTP